METVDSPTVEETTATESTTPQTPEHGIEGLPSMEEIAAMSPQESKEFMDQLIDIQLQEAEGPTDQAEETPAQEATETVAEEQQETTQNEEDPIDVEDNTAEDDPLFADEADVLDTDNQDGPTGEETNIYDFLTNDADKVWSIPDKTAPGGFRRLTGNQLKSALGHGVSYTKALQQHEENVADFNQQRDDTLAYLGTQALAFDAAVNPQMKEAMDNVQAFNVEIAKLEQANLTATGSEKITNEAKLQEYQQGRQANIDFIENNRPVYDQYQKLAKDQFKRIEDETRKGLEGKMSNQARFSQAKSMIVEELGDAADFEYAGLELQDIVAARPEVFNLLLDGVRYRKVSSSKPVGVTKVNPAPAKTAAAPTPTPASRGGEAALLAEAEALTQELQSGVSAIRNEEIMGRVVEIQNELNRLSS